MNPHNLSKEGFASIFDALVSEDPFVFDDSREYLQSSINADKTLEVPINFAEFELKAQSYPVSHHVGDSTMVMYGGDAILVPDEEIETFENLLEEGDEERVVGFFEFLRDRLYPSIASRKWVKIPFGAKRVLVL